MRNSNHSSMREFLLDEVSIILVSDSRGTINVEVIHLLDAVGDFDCSKGSLCSTEGVA